MNKSDIEIEKLVLERYPSETDVRKRFEYKKQLLKVKQESQVEIISAVEKNWKRVQQFLKEH